MQLSDLDFKTHTWSILSRGYTGCGKTIASCGKEFRPIYVFDFDNRMTSVAKYYKNLDGHAKGIVYDNYAMGDNWKDADKKMDEIMARPEFKTVAVASLTSFIYFVLAHLLNNRVGRSGKGKVIADIRVNEIEDYLVEDAALIFELLKFLMSLKNQGVNVILEAHLTPITYHILEGNRELTKIDTLTKGKKAPASIPGYFDESWLFTKELVADGANVKTKYIMNPVGDVLTDAKTSRGLTKIDWTGKDFTVELMKQLKG